MACWYLVTLVWRDAPPGPAQCEELNRDLHELDYDLPKVTPFGIEAARWRSPILTLEELLDFCDCVGYPCKGKLTRYDSWEDDGEYTARVTHECSTEWALSKFWVHEKYARLIRPRHTRFERI